MTQNSVSGNPTPTAIATSSHRRCFRAVAFSFSVASIRPRPHQSPSVMTTQYWLVKSEPEAYAWTDLVRDKRTAWTGVRSYPARLNLNAMRRGDQVLFYESVTTKAVIGIAEVIRTAFPDDTADEPGWVAVELAAVSALPHPVPLAAIKAEPRLANIALLRQSRLSVLLLSADAFARIVKLGN